MPSYVCLIYRKDDTVATVEMIDGVDDEGAIAIAAAINFGERQVRGYELWRSGVKITSNLPWGQKSAHLHSDSGPSATLA